jgi:hypothetical protein
MRTVQGRQNCGRERQTAHPAFRTEERKRWQSNDRDNHRSDIWDARRCGKGQVNRQICFVERGFRQVHSGYRAAAYCRPHQDQNQHPPKSPQFYLTQSPNKVLLTVPIVNAKAAPEAAIRRNAVPRSGTDWPLRFP